MHCSIMCGLWLCLTTITCRHYPNLLIYKCLSKWRGKQKSSLCHLNTECTATPRDSNHYFPDCHLKPGFTSPLKTCGAVLYFFRGHLLPACAHEVTLLYGLEDKACLLFSRSKKTALKPTRWLCRERYLTGKPVDPGLMLGTQGGRMEPTPVLFITGPHPHTHGVGGWREATFFVPVLSQQWGTEARGGSVSNSVCFPSISAQVWISRTHFQSQAWLRML